MASRPVIIVSLLGASIGVPYFAAMPQPSEKPPTSAPRAPTNSAATTPSPASAAAPALSLPPATSLALGSAAPAVTATPAEGPRFTSVEQFLRLDVTKDWVYRHWSRKSTGPTDVGLFGVRVPLVMGTRPSALAGSLTYYFNTYGQVEHISFHGWTADTTQLVQFLVRTYEFQRVESPVGEQVYQVRRRGRPQSELRTRTESVLDSASPQRSIAVELELARPGSRRFLPARGPYLALPPATSTAPAPTDSAAQAAGDSYLDRIRYANPNERGQVLWKRWPN